MSKGLLLPGYFPYYPVAGHLSIWDQNSNSLKVNTRFNETSFSVRVNTALKVFSNLPEQADRNTFFWNRFNRQFICRLTIQRKLQWCRMYQQPGRWTDVIFYDGRT